MLRRQAPLGGVEDERQDGHPGLQQRARPRPSRSAAERRAEGAAGLADLLDQLGHLAVGARPRARSGVATVIRRGAVGEGRQRQPGLQRAAQRRRRPGRCVVVLPRSRRTGRPGSARLASTCGAQLGVGPAVGPRSRPQQQVLPARPRPRGRGRSRSRSCWRSRALPRSCSRPTQNTSGSGAPTRRATRARAGRDLRGPLPEARRQGAGLGEPGRGDGGEAAHGLEADDGHGEHRRAHPAGQPVVRRVGQPHEPGGRARGRRRPRPRPGRRCASGSSTTRTTCRAAARDAGSSSSSLDQLAPPAASPRRRVTPGPGPTAARASGASGRLNR